MSFKRTLKLLVVLFVVASVVHYALFGSLPLGKPALADEN